MRSLFLILCLGLWIGASPARAADASISQAFKAYEAALAAGDMAAAEKQAAIAWQAAESGGDPKRAILAINLAQVRLELGDRSGALAPAERALALAQETPASVPLALAQLLAARARLDVDKRPTRVRLNEALEAAVAAEAPPAMVFAAARDLGDACLAQACFFEARKAWGIARANVGDDQDEIEALIGAAIAEIYSNSGALAIKLLDQADVLLSPLLPRPTIAWTRAEILSARITAWRAAAITTLQQSQRKQSQANPQETSGRGPEPDNCPVRLVPKVSLARQLEKAALGSNAGLVFGYDVTESGAVTNVVLLAAAPAQNESIALMAEYLANGVVVERRDTAPAGCPLERRFSKFVFRYSYEP